MLTMCYTDLYRSGCGCSHSMVEWMESTSFSVLYDLVS